MRRLLPKTSALSVFVTAVGLAFFPQLAISDSFTFTTLPANGNVAGAAGSVVGWGYSITNQSAADWLVTTNLTADPFQNGNPTLLFDFPFLAPGQTVTESFNPASSFGLYELAWNSNAPANSVNSGNFVLSAQWWTGDPTGTGVLIADATDVSAPYSASVGSSTVVPEPSSFLLLISAAAVFAFCLPRSRHFAPRS
jgi:hypothetical protein